MTFILAASGKKQSGKDTLLRGIRPFLETYGEVKYYSFADELKNFLQTGLGLKYEQVWGTDAEKNTPTVYCWETLPSFIRWERGGCYCLLKSGRKIQLQKAQVSRGSTYSDNSFESLYIEAINNGMIPVDLKSGFMSGRDLMQVFGTDIMRKMFSDTVWVNALFRAIEKDNPAIALIPDMRFPSEFVPLHEKGARVIRLTRDVSQGDFHASETALDDWPWHSYTNVLVIPNDATITSSQEMTIEWLSNQMK
jgi:hypothetical protein